LTELEYLLAAATGWLAGWLTLYGASTAAAACQLSEREREGGRREVNKLES